MAAKAEPKLTALFEEAVRNRMHGQPDSTQIVSFLLSILSQIHYSVVNQKLLDAIQFQML